MTVEPSNTSYSFVGKWGSNGTDGEFLYPDRITTDNQGNVYVYDTHSVLVQMFTGDGKFLTKWSIPQMDPGQLVPNGMAADDPPIRR